MLLSFILTTSANKNDYLDHWLTAIFQQKKDNFEIIIVDDSSNDNNLITISKYFRLYPNIIKIITNYKVAGIAKSRNLGIKFAVGKYLIILSENEVPSADFISVISKTLTENPELDCIEYCAYYELVPNYIFHSTIRTDINKIYRLKTTQGKSVFALTAPILSTKILKRAIINENRIIFRKEIQLDSLFLYSFLAHANNYLAINKILITSKTNSLQQDNNFDLMNQWFHILNYYHNQKLKKQLSVELEYAFVRYALYNFLKFVSISKKSILIQKAYDHAKMHVLKRYKNFKNNPYLKTINQNDPFTIIATDLSQYFKKYFKENNIKDDSRIWE